MSLFNEFLHIKWRLVLNCALYYVYEHQALEIFNEIFSGR